AEPQFRLYCDKTANRVRLQAGEAFCVEYRQSSGLAEPFREHDCIRPIPGRIAISSNSQKFFTFGQALQIGAKNVAVEDVWHACAEIDSRCVGGSRGETVAVADIPPRKTASKQIGCQCIEWKSAGFSGSNDLRR